MRAAPLYACFNVFLAGVSRLMDLLADSREVIRNDVSMGERQLILLINSDCQLHCLALAQSWVQLSRCMWELPGTVSFLSWVGWFWVSWI